MAGIDKTYVNAQELKEAIAWAKEIGTVTLENGYKFAPLDFIHHYDYINDPDFDWNRDEYILWNTPQWFDRWLWLNCPLEFVKNRLEEQYGEDYLKEFEKYVWHDSKQNSDFGHQHYTFLKSPTWRSCKQYMGHGRKNNPWPGNCNQLTYSMEIYAPKDRDDLIGLEYNVQTDTWEEKFGMMPTTPWRDYVWQYYHNRIPNKKSIIRELRRWYIPNGYTVRLYNLQSRCFDFEILVRK